MKYQRQHKIDEAVPFQFKILVVEDDASLCELLEDIFVDVGYAYEIVADVKEIIPLLNEHQPHLVLIDYLLPSNNGGDLCLQIKNDDTNAHLPVIIYSAVNKALLPINEYRCDAFIEKPFDLDVLLQKMDNLLLSSQYTA
jgi:DNA-binding response OmpR family regulator